MLLEEKSILNTYHSFLLIEVIDDDTDEQI